MGEPVDYIQKLLSLLAPSGGKGKISEEESRLGNIKYIHTDKNEPLREYCQKDISGSFSTDTAKSDKSPQDGLTQGVEPESVPAARPHYLTPPVLPQERGTERGTRTHGSRPAEPLSGPGAQPQGAPETTPELRCDDCGRTSPGAYIGMDGGAWFLCDACYLRSVREHKATQAKIAAGGTITPATGHAARMATKGTFTFGSAKHVVPVERDEPDEAGDDR